MPKIDLKVNFRDHSYLSVKLIKARRIKKNSYNLVKFEMEIEYTKYDIQISSIQRTIGKTFFKAYSQQINIRDDQGISSLYHNINFLQNSPSLPNK